MLRHSVDEAYLDRVVPTTAPKPTKRPMANAESGSNRYLRKAKTGTAWDASAYDGSGGPNARRSCVQLGKISNCCLKNEGRCPFPTEAIGAFFLAALMLEVQHGER